ncbi:MULTISPECIES: DUF3379 family protein [unclassified Photobacterium]|uniref:DUF3379 family protein n=1 Tax=unclassified Photobacterium TaxID=2628852 RepID=UPI000D15DF1D|nr:MULTISPECIES: DUF3379 family protein [unclassified Photobacterium]PSV33352.1 DUF3379 domain-containing protein [Photobacterium sp. GB-72]PSW75412.1 DUF3379 domain-containing protein [Photobacterium sp. GB-50]
MDELEFRRRLLADPHDNDPTVTACKHQSIANKKFSDELQQLDIQLEQALKVDVPDDLADKILFQQAGEETSKKGINRYWSYGLAASVAFAIGLFVGQMNLLPSQQLPINSLANVALEHVSYEAKFVDNIDEKATLQQVNAKLQPFGSEMKDLPGHIYYVNYCGFDGKRSLHMVMDTPQGKVTVFVVPTPSHAISNSTDNNNESLVVPIREASLIIVGDKGQNLMPVASKIKNDLSWEI